MITQLDKTSLGTIREQVTAKLKELEALGVKFRLGSCTYLSKSATFKLDVFVPGDEGTDTPERLYFQQAAKFVGLDGQLDKSFTFRGTTYKIVGMKRGRSAANILGQRADGKTFRFMASDVVRFLGVPATV